jgi:uncharacterized protein (UPF0333 family)
MIKSTKDGEVEMENIIVVIIVVLAAVYIGRSYYKKYKKGNQCSCGCAACPADTSSCDFPEERSKQISDLQEKNQ